MSPTSSSVLGFLLISQLCESVLNSASHTIRRGRSRIRLKEGEVVGRIEESGGVLGEVYDSIPYAEEPDGELRFELPRPISAWPGTLNSSRLSHCYQYATMDATHTTMDCLHVKVVVPLDANRQRFEEPLPVIMWIHGGSYQHLGKALYNTSGILTALSSRKIIFVAVAYRLGIFGFLSLLSRDLPGNFALHDITAALRFIHANAVSFGADSTRISIAGESAGAAAASILAVSPLTKGLISSSLCFSGSIYSPWAVRTAVTANRSLSFITAIGCRRETTREIKRCLQELPLDLLRRHEHRFMNDTEQGLFEMYRMGCSAFTPVEDGFMQNLSQIPHKMDKLKSLEGAAKVPVLLSTTTDERLVATRDLVLDQFEKSGQSVIHFLPSIMKRDQRSLAEVVSTIVGHYFNGNSKMDNATFERLLTISQNGEQFAAAHAEALDYVIANQSVFLLKSDVHGGKYPSWHGIDVWVLFDCFDMANRTGIGNWSYEQWRTFDGFRNRLADTVAEFATTGSIANFTRFSTVSRSATKISPEGFVTVDADTDDYYFWRKTLPSIESLHDSPMTRIAIRSLVCTRTYQIPFYVATTLLIACMVACGFLFSQRKRRPKRERKALRHDPLD